MHTNTKEGTDGKELTESLGVVRTNLETADNEHIDYPIQRQISERRIV